MKTVRIRTLACLILEQQHEKYVFFFFSSRRRHTRSKRDWSSDVCSSDLLHEAQRSSPCVNCSQRRGRSRSEERRVGKSVDLGGRRIIKKKKKKKKVLI